METLRADLLTARVRRLRRVRHPPRSDRDLVANEDPTARPEERGPSPAEGRPTALLVALCILLAFALGAGAVVAAKTITGTKKGEVLKGTKRADRISGRGGDDLIKGKGGRDRLSGNGGNDTLQGGKGKDRMAGGAGSNQLNMVDGVEQGSPGNDVIRARNGQPDEIDCGAGNDRVIVDRVEDGVFNCETVVSP